MSFTPDIMAPPSSQKPIVQGPALSDSAANAINAHMADIAMCRTPAHGEGTVLAVVTFPRDDKSSRACDGEPWYDTRIRMNHDKLMSLGSKKISDMFTPRAQARYRRRLAMEQLPPGIEYVVDFTPPSEGPELADLTAALWLPRMVRLWFLAGQYLPDNVLESGPSVTNRPLADKAIGAILTLGHDDVCKNPICLSDQNAWQPQEAIQGIFEDGLTADMWHYIPEWRKVNDYCPIRHRVSIIRLLRAINGQDLFLNSAVRLWTVAQVAISLDVPQVVVDPVTQWLVAPPNTKFLEICPERAFQLAYALKIPSVLIASFKILVSELAIDYASSNPTPGRSQLTWAQRRRDDYGDYPSDPVEYASRAFTERMTAKLKMLQSDEVFDLLPLRLAEWEKLKYYGTLISALPSDHPLHKGYAELTQGLISALHRWVELALNPVDLSKRFGQRMSDLVEAQRSHYIPLTEIRPLLALYHDLNPAQKALTPFFWDELDWTLTRHSFLTHNPPGDPTKTIHLLFNSFNSHLMRAIFAGEIRPDPSNTALAGSVPKTAAEAETETTTGWDFEANGNWDISRDEFYNSLRRAVDNLCSNVLRRNYGADNDGGISFFLSDHLLLTLDERELNYLPIWADGLDDGSGGVFQEVIPNAEMGPSEPGPGYHTGYTVGGGTETGGDDDDGRSAVFTGYGAVSTVGPPRSDLEIGELKLASIGTGSGSGGTDLGAGTAGRSLRVQESGASTGDSAVLVGGAGGGASGSEAFTADDEGMYADARFAQPAAHQAQGQAIEQYVQEAEAEERRTAGGGVDGFMDLDSEDEEMDFGSDDDGSSTLDGFEEVDAEEAL